MLTGGEREALLEVADRLCLELGWTERDAIPDLALVLGAPAGTISPEDEQLVAGIRQGLAKIAAAVSNAGPEDSAYDAAGSALNSVEMVMRGELMMGNAAELPTLLPGFVHLVISPIVDRDTALNVSQRAAELIASLPQR